MPRFHRLHAAVQRNESFRLVAFQNRSSGSLLNATCGHEKFQFVGKPELRGFAQAGDQLPLFQRLGLASLRAAPVQSQQVDESFKRGHCRARQQVFEQFPDARLAPPFRGYQLQEVKDLLVGPLTLTQDVAAVLGSLLEKRRIVRRHKCHDEEGAKAILEEGLALAGLLFQSRE